MKFYTLCVIALLCFLGARATMLEMNFIVPGILILCGFGLLYVALTSEKTLVDVEELRSLGFQEDLIEEAEFRASRGLPDIEPEEEK